MGYQKKMACPRSMTQKKREEEKNIWTHKGPKKIKNK